MTKFYVFAISNSIFASVLIVALISLYRIAVSKNPINIILLLILFFFDNAILLVYCGADYLAVPILILYAGAISIILLFVVMLLDMKDLILQEEEPSKLMKPFFLMYVVCVIVKTIQLLVYNLTHFIPRVQHFNWIRMWHQRTNIEVVGAILYEQYLFQFLVIGVFLFLVMIIIISLIINYNFISKKQKLSDQLKKTNFKMND